MRKDVSSREQRGPEPSMLDVRTYPAPELLSGVSDNDLQLIIDSIPALAWSARSDGTGNFFNRFYLSYVGLSVEEVRDWQWTSAIHPDDVGRLMATWETFRDASRGGEVEARIRRHDGVYRWFSFRSNPLCDDDGNVVQWYGINIDIEDQRHALYVLEAERELLELVARAHPLHELLAHLCSVVEEAIDGCFCEVRTINAQSMVYETAVAPSLPDHFGADIPGMPLDRDGSPIGLAAVRQAEIVVAEISANDHWRGTPFEASCTAAGIRSVHIFQITTSSGGHLGTLTLYFRHPNDELAHHRDLVSRMTHLAGIAIERLRAQNELRRREYLLATSEGISKTGSFVWDLNADQVVFSEQMRAIFGFGADADIVRPDLRSYYHPDDLPLLDEKIARVFRGEGYPENVERLIMPGGDIKYVRNAYRVVHHDDGRKECFGVSQDVTEQRLADDALNQLRSELAHVTRVTSLGELAASITHEVNQPLSGIISNANACQRLLAASPPDIEGAIKTAQRSVRDGNRAAEVLRRLRGLFRRQEFSPEPFDLNEAAQEVISICSHDLQRRRIAIAVSFEEELPRVNGDRIQLQQVILNLLLNAADAIDSIEDRPRRVAIDTRLQAGLAQLSVRDTGHGIEADNRKLFEPFYTTKPDGMGVGLSVSKSILDQHGGRIWATPNQDWGATFSFSLPTVGDHRDGAAPASGG